MSRQIGHWNSMSRDSIEYIQLREGETSNHWGGGAGGKDGLFFFFFQISGLLILAL